VPDPRAARDTLKEFEQVSRLFFVQALGGTPGKPIPVAVGGVWLGEKSTSRIASNEFAIAYYHQTADRDYIVMSHAGADTFPHRGARVCSPPWSATRICRCRHG